MLWSTFSVKQTSNALLLVYWIKRTRGAPLAITFQQVHSFYKAGDALKLLFMYDHQWADVEIPFGPTICAKLLRLRPQRLRLLKKLSVEHGGHITADDLKRSIFFLDQLPALSDLTWNHDIDIAQFKSNTWSNLGKFSTAIKLRPKQCLELFSPD